MSYKIEVVSDRRSQIGEGPFWDNGTLLHVDVTAGDICRLNPETKQTQERHFDDFVTTVFPTEASSTDLIVSLGSRLAKLDDSTGEFKTLSHIDNDNGIRFNDGKCDASGRLWIGSMGVEKTPGVFEKQKGALYKVEKDFQPLKQVDRVGISNGLAWSSDNKTMFFIDSLLKRVDAFDYNIQDGILSRRRIVAKFTENEGLPDGMTIDQKGHLWVAFYNGWKIIELEPEKGEVLQTISFPVGEITSCCFGGVNYEDLYVTTGQLHLNEEEIKAQPLAGSVFKVSGLGVKGFAGCKIQQK